MLLNELKGNLFSLAPRDYKLAHCIAADAGMGRGIAVDFTHKFPQIKRLRKMDLEVGKAYYIDPVFNLVTKRRSPGKPSYESMCHTLKHFRENALEVGVDRIAMPRIGCGLDRLSWPAVREMLKEVFAKDNIVLNVYTLKGGDKLKNTITVTGDAAMEISAVLIIDKLLDTEASSTAWARKIQEHFPGVLDGTWRVRAKGIGKIVMETDRPLASASSVKKSQFLPKEPFTAPSPEPTVIAEEHAPTTVVEKPKSRARHMWDIVKSNLL